MVAARLFVDITKHDITAVTNCFVNFRFERAADDTIGRLNMETKE